MSRFENIPNFSSIGDDVAVKTEAKACVNHCVLEKCVRSRF